MVLSIIAYSLSASTVSKVTMPPPTPLFAQRVHRRGVLFQSPKLSGRSRQGIPVRYRCITASTNRRLLAAVTPTEPARPGNPFLIRSHWSSRSWWGRMDQPLLKLIPGALYFNLCIDAFGNGDEDVGQPHESVPCVTAPIDDSLIVLINNVAELITSEVLPEIL